MKGLEFVFDGKKLVSIVFRKNLKSPDSLFITPKEYPMQIGIHANSTKKITNKHKNGILKISAEINRHEFLLVQLGNICVDYFSKKGILICSKKLLSGDGVLIMNVTHQVTMSKKSKVIEIKQGPYAEKS